MSHVSNENPVMENNGARKRTCTDEGTEYFLATAAKNCKTLRKKIRKLIVRIEDLLERADFVETNNAMGVLIGVHEEYTRSYLRYNELLTGEVDSSEETLFKETAELLKEVQERHDEAVAAASVVVEERNLPNIQHRHETHRLINEEIALIEDFIRNNKLVEADKEVVELDILFGKFMEFEPQSLDNASLREEGNIRDSVDEAIFAVKRSLSDAKHELEKDIYRCPSSVIAYLRHSKQHNKFTTSESCSFKRQ